jgi:hypothetical protein
MSSLWEPQFPHPPKISSTSSPFNITCFGNNTSNEGKHNVPILRFPALLALFQKHVHKPPFPYHIMAKYYHDDTTTNQLIHMGTETKEEAGAKKYKIHRQTKGQRGL